MFGTAAQATMFTRRRMLHLAVATVTVAAAGCGSTAPHRIRLGSGLAGGLFHEFGNTLAEAAGRSPTVRITPVPTAGSVTNLDLLENGTIDAALTLGDTAVAIGTRGLAVGRLYESYIHLAVHIDSPVRHIGDLRGTRVDVGVAGSGAALTAERLFRTAGLDPGTDITVHHRELAEAAEALRSRTVDAILWGAGVPTPESRYPDPSGFSTSGRGCNRCGNGSVTPTIGYRSPRTHIPESPGSRPSGCRC